MQDPDATRKRFVEHLAADRLAEEAEVGIRVQAKAAWPVAQVFCRVLAQFPSIRELFWGRMYSACPYLAPNYAGSQANRPGLAPGQRNNEPFTDFADRMMSYQRLWVALVTTEEDLAAVWLWLARTLNEPPTPITAPLLYAVLEFSGSDAHRRYGKQFVKLLDYITRIYMGELEALQGQARGEEVDQLKASLSRLRKWLESFRGRGHSPPPVGRNIEDQEEDSMDPWLAVCG